MNIALVFFGGGIGCVMRYLIGMGFQKSTSSLPLATFLSNVSACLIFAVVLWFIQQKNETTHLRLLLLTGLCGGLSTFSTFGYETFLLLKQSLYLVAFINIILSCSICLFIFYIFN